MNSNKDEQYQVASLFYSRRGSGEPLLLIHGLGSNHRTWDNILPYLGDFDVVTVDLSGHGQSPEIPGGVAPTPTYLRDRVIDLLDELGLEAPHIAGNSLGGWLALELARSGRAKSLTLLAPAGLWRDRDRLLNRIMFPLLRGLAAAFRPALLLANRTAIGRIVLLGAFSARPWAVPVDDANTAISAFGSSSGFYRIRRELHRTRFRDGASISNPITVVYGTQDRLLPPAAQRRDELPAAAMWIRVPGCGHVPMMDVPEFTAETIRATAKRCGI